MKTTQALKFKNGIVMNLHDQALTPNQLRLISEVVQTGERFIINANLSNQALYILDYAHRNPKLNTDAPLHFESSKYENGLGVTKYNGVYVEVMQACEKLADEIDLPILINVGITPELAYELITRNDKPFIIAGCHVMAACMNYDLRGQSGTAWIDDSTVNAPKLKNEPCVKSGVKLFKDLSEILSQDIPVAAITLKQLQDKAIQYDELKKQLDEIRAKSEPMIEIAERYERIRVLFETEYENEDLEAHEFIGKIKDILDGKEEPETFDRADYRDE